MPHMVEKHNDVEQHKSADVVHGKHDFEDEFKHFFHKSPFGALVKKMEWKQEDTFLNSHAVSIRNSS